MKIFLIFETFGVPRQQSCRLSVTWQHLMGSTGLGQEPQLQGSAAQQGTWQVWSPKKEGEWMVSVHHTSQEQTMGCCSRLWYHCTSDLTAVWEDNPPYSEHISAAFGSKEVKNSVSSFSGQNIFSISGKIKFFKALLQSRTKTAWKCQDFSQKENAKFWPLLVLGQFLKKHFFNLIIHFQSMDC